MFADAASWWAAGASMIVAGGVVFARKSPINRAIRWLWRHNIKEPMGGWFRAQVREVTSEVVDEKLLARNGGTTVPDAISAVNELRAETTERHADNRIAIHRIDGKVDDLVLQHQEDRVAIHGVERSVGELATRVETLTTAVTKDHP